MRQRVSTSTDDERPGERPMAEGKSVKVSKRVWKQGTGDALFVCDYTQ